MIPSTSLPVYLLLAQILRQTASRPMALFESEFDASLRALSDLERYLEPLTTSIAYDNEDAESVSAVLVQHRCAVLDTQENLRDCLRLTLSRDFIQTF